ncbi:MAG: gamma-glutamyl-gamma-aminobutyrate hydrolase family protein [Leptolyngbya sp.]|nr:gamma-glutamyl-gamma-aminobutyrate hydrolase family protein [Candidatus Melainabacteria bacterium]
MHKIRAFVMMTVVLATSCSSPVWAKSTASEINRRPIIGVNVDVDGDKPRLFKVSAKYINAIKESGAIPLLLPPMNAEQLRQVLHGLDGVLMVGGADYPPDLYQQKTEPTTSLMDEERWRFDILLAKTVVEETEMPFLGICAGCQALNISQGGSLIQDIPTKLPEMKVAHASKDGWQTGFNVHEVTFEKGTKLKEIYKVDALSVPTSHHQCVEKLGKDLRVAARTADGLTEAVEMPGKRFVFGVQWHPERDFSANNKLFQNLVESAGAFMQRRHH